MIYETTFDDTFLDHIKKFTLIDRKLIFSKIELLKNNPNHNSLRTQKLRKSHNNWYESSVNMSIRLFWRFNRAGDTIIIEDVGRHDILKKYG